MATKVFEPIPEVVSVVPPNGPMHPRPNVDWPVVITGRRFHAAASVSIGSKSGIGTTACKVLSRSSTTGITIALPRCPQTANHTECTCEIFIVNPDGLQTRTPFMHSANIIDRPAA